MKQLKKILLMEQFVLDVLHLTEKKTRTISRWLFPLRKVIGEVMKKYQVMLCLAIQVADTDGWQSRTRLTETALPHSKY